MRTPQLIKILLWRLFLCDRSRQGKLVIYNYIKYDSEYDADIYLVFVGGQRGHLFMGGVDHSDTSVTELVQGLEQDIKTLYNETGCDYEIQTVMEGEETKDFTVLKMKALEPLTIRDKLNHYIANICYG